MSKILITGITGFVGSHLAEYILSLNENHEIYGLCRWRSNRENLSNVIDKVNLMHGDLLDLSSLIKIFQEHKFDYIFHLAAQSYVLTSFDSPINTLETNIIGTANLLEAIRNSKQDPKIMICSSSEVYGQVTQEETPIKETNQLRPASPYAVSKVGEDLISQQYFLSYNMKIIRSRAFTHEGERRGDVFFLSAFAKQIAAIEMGLLDKVHVGNLDSIRTICDVRDMVRAYWLLINKCTIGEVYNIGGIESFTINEVLDILKRQAYVPIKYVIDEKLLRPSDVTLQLPNIDKFMKATNWKPEISIKQTCSDILNYWRDELKKNLWKLKSVTK